MNNSKKGFIGGISLGIAITIIATFGINTFNIMASGNDNTILDKAATIKAVMDKYYIEDIPDEVIKEGVYRGMVSSANDPYTVYFDSKEYADFKTDSDGTFSGIGVSVLANPTDNTILITAVFEGTSGEEVGLMPGDRIIKVNGIDVTAKKIDTAVTMMRGKEGTTVDVTIYRESNYETFDVTIPRKLVEVPTVAYKMLEDNIGYIELTNFDGVSYDQFKKAYDALNSAGQKGLIVDLRFNPGGRLDIVEKIADLLVPKGPIVYIEYKGEEKKEDSISDATCIEIPLVLLVNGYSASASEVLTGAVKDYSVGKIVGTKTYGKGIVQSLIPLPDGSGIKVTSAKYYTPSGVSIHKTGIEPDYVVELPKELKNVSGLPYEQDTQLQKAVEVIMNDMNKK